MLRFIRIFIVLSMVLAGCGGSPFELDNITGVNYGHDFALTDHNGRPRTLADFHGKVVALYFGYVHCPDYCPTTLADLAQTARLLGADAARFQVLFVTVDPERDTPAVLSQFVPSFNPAFLGLYGDAAATARVAQEFRIVYKKYPLPGNDYTVDHSVGTFIFGPDGQLRLFAQYGARPQAMAHDIKLLLQGA
ncbi:MAG TPA: SCO family protein [Burkholderiales bacterium]|nr:SCO family protein [Burkholderiales bacterium]